MGFSSHVRSNSADAINRFNTSGSDNSSGGGNFDRTDWQLTGFDVTIEDVSESDLTGFKEEFLLSLTVVGLDDDEDDNDLIRFDVEDGIDGEFGLPE